LNDSFDHIKNIAIVCHNKAGKGKAIGIARYLFQKLQGLKIECVVFNNIVPENIEPYTRIWLVGGDGTLNFFINKHPSVNIPIALFKGGTGNDFAWKLYGDKTVDEYFDIALNGIARKVDGGICNKKYFVNGVGIGFDGEVAHAMGANKFLSGHGAYLFAVLQKVLFYQEKQMMIETETWTRDEELFMITAANGSRYGGGFLVAPQAIIDDGKLDIVIIKKIPPLLRFFHLPKVKKGKHLVLSFVETYRSAKLSVRAANPLTAHIDGETMQANHFEIEVLPQKFLFLC
jgi:diacylglycerol kinase (ATP)